MADMVTHKQSTQLAELANRICSLLAMGSNDKFRMSDRDYGLLFVFTRDVLIACVEKRALTNMESTWAKNMYFEGITDTDIAMNEYIEHQISALAKDVADGRNPDMVPFEKILTCAYYLYTWCGEGPVRGAVMSMWDEFGGKHGSGLLNEWGVWDRVIDIPTWMRVLT